MAAIPKNWTNGTLTMKDGTATPVELILTLDQGDLSISGITAGYRAQTRYQRRGAHVAVQKGERTYISGSFSSMMSQMNEAGTGHAAAFASQIGFYSANVSTQGAGSELPYTIDLYLDIEGSDLGDADIQVIIKDASVSFDFSEGDPDSLAFSFEATTIAGTLAIIQT